MAILNFQIEDVTFVLGETRIDVLDVPALAPVVPKTGIPFVFESKRSAE